jgi:hypothetical protein
MYQRLGGSFRLPGIVRKQVPDMQRQIADRLDFRIFRRGFDNVIQLRQSLSNALVYRNTKLMLEQGALFDGKGVRYLAGRQTDWHLIR